MASEDTIANVEAECFCDSEAEILECGPSKQWMDNA